MRRMLFIIPQKKAFNLCSGKHRAAFFASLKKKFIPLKINKKEYELFINLDSVTEVSTRLNKAFPDEIIAPIEHPYFYAYPCRAKEFWYNFVYGFLYHIADNLYRRNERIDFEDISICSYVRDLGFFERVFERTGCSIDMASDHDKECIVSLDKLFSTHIANNRVIKEYYDYCVVDSELFDLQKDRDILFDIMRKAKETIILFPSERRSNIEKEIEENGYTFNGFFNSANMGYRYLAYIVKKSPDLITNKLKIEEIASLTTIDNEDEYGRVLKHIRKILDQDASEIIVQDVDD